MKNKLNAIYALIAVAVIWMSLNTHMILGVKDQNKQDEEAVAVIVNDMVERIVSLESYTQETLPEINNNESLP